MFCGVPYVCFVNWTRVLFLFYSGKAERFLMRHTSFKHRQTSNHGQFFTGGKAWFYAGSKNAKCEFIHGCIFIQWINLEQLTVATFLTFRKSFETGTYNNTKSTSTNHPATKTISKNCPLDKLTAAEGFFRKISHWINPKKQQQINHPNQRGCTSLPALMKQKNQSQPNSSTHEKVL
jgi:hypothetical protein